MFFEKKPACEVVSARLDDINWRAGQRVSLVHRTSSDNQEMLMTLDVSIAQRTFKKDNV